MKNYLSDPEKRKRQTDLAKISRAENPELRRQQNHRNSIAVFGLTVEQYDHLMALQLGACAICGQHEKATWKGKPKRLAIDHCHKSKAIRGLLCTKCNLAIGSMDDDPEIAANAYYYLMRDIPVIPASSTPLKRKWSRTGPRKEKFVWGTTRNKARQA